jgi:outer membrane protein TolC
VAQRQGDTGSLADFQQAEIDQQLRRCAESRARVAASRERLARVVGGPASAPLDEDDPVSLEAHGFPFRAAWLRRERAEAEHSTRRNRVEAEVRGRPEYAGNPS